MCEPLAQDFQQKLSIAGKDHCRICLEKPGFPILCNTGDPGEHRFCTNCVVEQSTHEEYSNEFLCSVCRSRFNFKDYLVVSELHLLQSNSSQFILNYFHEIQSGEMRDRLSLEDFLSLEKKDQKRVISILYWGNDSLFDGVNNYPKDTKNRRIKENLVEMLGNLWSFRLGRKEKNKQLSQIFKNGRSIRYCQNESQETFLHRCHLFLRAFVPLNIDINADFKEYMNNIKKFFPSYSKLGRTPSFYLPITYRPPTGPLNIELVGPQTEEDTSAFLDWQRQYKHYLDFSDCK